MRVFGIFISLLTAEICSPTATQAWSRNTDAIIRKLNKIVMDPDSISSNKNVIRFIEIEKRLKKNCDKNGGPMAHNDLASSLLYFSSCMKSHFNSDQLQAEVVNAQLHGDWKPLLNSYCPELPTLKECGNRIGDSIKPCLAPDEQIVMNMMQSSLSLFMAFTCHDGGDKIRSFIAAGGAECLASKKESLQVCAMKSFRDNFNNLYETAISGLSSLSSLHLDEEECSNIEGFQKCVVHVFKRCNNPKPADVVVSIFTFVKNLTSCQNMKEDLESDPRERSHVSTARITMSADEVRTSTVLLITIRMILFLRL